MMQDELALLARTAYWCLGLVFQLNDLGMNALPLFLGTLNVYVLLKMHCGGNRWIGGQLMAHRPPQPHLYHPKWPLNTDALTLNTCIVRVIRALVWANERMTQPWFKER